MVELRLATYNIHRAIGRDGKHSLARIAAVIHDIAPHVIGLQEVESRHAGDPNIPELNTLAKYCQLTAVSGPTLWRHDSSYGNALLTCGHVEAIRRHDLSVPGREPRGLLEVEVRLDHRLLRVLVTHFGLRARERQQQASRLIQVLASNTTVIPTVLLGDFNEWRRRSPVLKTLSQVFVPAPAPRTFPSHMPLFSLDRIWLFPHLAIRDVLAHRTSLARTASDHLPVGGTLQLDSVDIRPRKP